MDLADAVRRPCAIPLGVESPGIRLFIKSPSALPHSSGRRRRNRLWGVPCGAAYGWSASRVGSVRAPHCVFRGRDMHAMGIVATRSSFAPIAVECHREVVESGVSITIGLGSAPGEGGGSSRSVGHCFPGLFMIPCLVGSGQVEGPEAFCWATAAARLVGSGVATEATVHRRLRVFAPYRTYATTASSARQANFVRRSIPPRTRPEASRMSQDTLIRRPTKGLLSCSDPGWHCTWTQFFCVASQRFICTVSEVGLRWR